jgi:hypothetical protein
MPINAIRSANIFEDRLNPGEERNWVQIVFGINTQGTNQDVNSVASQVAKKYDETFWKIPRNDLAIGQVYSGQWYIHPALPARFHGIVCNEKELHTGKHDWTFADLGSIQDLRPLKMVLSYRNIPLVALWLRSSKKSRNSSRSEHHTIL